MTAENNEAENKKTVHDAVEPGEVADLGQPVDDDAATRDMPPETTGADTGDGDASSALPDPSAPARETPTDPPGTEAGDADDLPAAPAEMAALAARVDAVENALGEIRQQLDRLLDRATETISRTDRISDNISENQKLSAEQLRRFLNKVEQAASAAGNAQFRELAQGLVLFYDLVVGLADSRAPSDTHKVPDVCQMLGRQLTQLFASHGIEEIQGDGEPDYEVHRPVDREPVADPARVNQIVDVRRAGFRLGNRVLRPAEVVLGVAAANTSGDGASSGAANTPAEDDQETPPAD